MIKKVKCKNRLLLIMPFFMDYQESLKKTLQNDYIVELINSDQFDSCVINTYFKCSKIRWKLRHLFEKVLIHDAENAEISYYDDFLAQIKLERDYYQVIFCINGAYVPDTFYALLRNNNPHARFIYYAWDDIGNLLKQSHLKYFNERYVYNISECKQYHATYVPMFVQSALSGHEAKDEYDIAYIASAHSDRKQIAYELNRRYGEKYRLFIYLYDPSNSGDQFCQDTPLNYKQYLNVVRKSKAMLDVPHPEQEGPTTRSFDALLTKTKVITVNPHIKEYPIYSENIMIVDRDNIVIDDAFIKKPYIETGYQALTISDWLKKFNL